MCYIRVVRKVNGTVKIFNVPSIHKIEISKLLNSWNAKCIITNDCVITNAAGWDSLKEYLL